MLGLYYWWNSIWVKQLPIQIQDPTKTYIENTRFRFLQLIANDYSNPLIKRLSSNIDSLIYNKKALLQVLKDSDNSLEKSWRARMLMESTPVGNIVMFYDIFKQGFSYYCDQPVIPYDILNSVAMKYVVRFHCMDFFMDEYVLGEYGCSPLKAVFIEDDLVEGKGEKKPGVDLGVDLKTAPFAKFKNYSGSVVSNKDKQYGGKGRGIGRGGGASGRTPVYFRTNYPWLWKMWFCMQYYLVFPVYKMGIWTWRSLIRGVFGETWRVVEVEPPSKVSMDDCSNKNSDVVVVVEKEKMCNKFIYLGRFRNLSILQKSVKKNVFGGGSTKYDSMFVSSGKAVSYKDFKSGVRVSDEDGVAS